MIASFEEFKDTLEHRQPPKNWPVSLQALGYDYKGDWQTAHELVDQLGDPWRNGCMPTCTEKRVMNGMQVIGTVKRERLFASCL